VDETTFRRSSFCTDAHGCVEVAIGADDTVRIRDSKPDGAPLAFTATEWVAFLAGVKAGEFDL
jgi:hypothetical protein